VNVSPSADNALSFLFEVVVAGERLASFDVSLDVCHCAIFNEPFRLCRINLNKVVVNALIE